jgi:class 3 adenylate cyclase
MARCLNCGEENPERARFCLNCGTSLPSAAPAAEVRKIVSVLFADVVSSTSRSEQSDPESTRRMLARYFDAMRGVVERHGGTVEKFIGDAVMAVFGIPVLHEDDALRAVRAASEMRTAISSLNAELASMGWPAISLRIGVNTGEVVAGDPSVSQTLVTGDVTNVTQRLEAAAAPDEVVLGAATYRLVRDAVEAEPMPPLELKGKAAAVQAFRLVGLREREPGPRHDTPLVGRQRELLLLEQAFHRAADEAACYLFTLLGAPGVGKSRLVHEFLTTVSAETRVLRARCLPYGEGITFWPVRELVEVAADIGPADSAVAARGKLEALLGDSPEREGIVERVAATIGLSDAVVPTEESFWGVRKLVEWIARDGPLIVLIDDLHWAEPTLLDLVDHVADWSTEAPILLLAVARPDLLDARPQWGGGKLNATTILLEPLSADDSLALIGNLVSDADLARSVQDRIGGTAEGNPLFVEELVGMLIDDQVLRPVNGGWHAAADLDRVQVPPTIAALVAARLDHLEPPERDLIGRASVVGKVFQLSEVAELSPPERRDELGRRLMALVRKELLRRDRSTTIGDEAFQFRHMLVRDAAYAALPKEQRADLHARFADWLERVAADRLVEVEEVVAYHLEQAHGYRVELGLADELTRSLGSRAAAQLEATGLRAVARLDLPAVDNLLSRALTLLEDDRERVVVLLHLADNAERRGDRAAMRRLHKDARQNAERTGDELVVLRAELAWFVMQLGDPEADDTKVMELADRLETVAIARGDRDAQVAALISRANVYSFRCRWMDQLEALERAQALLVPGPDPWRWSTMGLPAPLLLGPIAAPEAMARIDAWAAGDEMREAARSHFIVPLLAMQGRFAEAEAHAAAALAYIEERGMRMVIGTEPFATARIKELAGDLEGATRDNAQGIAFLRSMGETGVLSTYAAMQANVLYRLGRRDELLAAVALAQETGAPRDIATQVYWRLPAARLAADDGRIEEAERLIGEAVALVEPTDYLEMRGAAFEALAHVEARAGRTNGWESALQRALAEHELKGNLVRASQVRERLAAGPPR